MTKAPELSIVVPVYNAEATLERCINSILLQEFADFELILVDDGSTDDCLDICQRFGNQDDRVVVLHKENGGQGSARNLGIDRAVGQFITFIDADDYVAPNTYRENINIFRQQADVDIVQFPYVRVRDGIATPRKDVQDVVIQGRTQLYVAWLEDRAVNNYFCNKLFRRSMFDYVRFPKNMVFEDRYLMCDMLNRCQKMALTDRGLYYYTYTDGQITSRPDDAYILQSKARADLHIVENIQFIEQLSHCLFDRYNNCITYLRQMKARNDEIDHGLMDGVLEALPPLSHILFTNSPLGIKSRMLLLKLVPSML